MPAALGIEAKLARLMVDKRATPLTAHECAYLSSLVRRYEDDTKAESERNTKLQGALKQVKHHRDVLMDQIARIHGILDNSWDKFTLVQTIRKIIGD